MRSLSPVGDVVSSCIVVIAVENLSHIRDVGNFVCGKPSLLQLLFTD